MSTADGKVNVVLVHAAWADGSSWSRVIQPLQAAGLNVIAAPIPLTSLDDDIAAVKRALNRTNGPVLLVAHAYSGAVVSGVDDERVSGLCFIASLTPDKGETVAEVFYRGAPHPLAPKLGPDPDGFIWLPGDAFPTAFAQHAPSAQSALLGALQRPISVKCIQQPAAVATWRSKPSWYLVAEEDRMINPETQRFLAQRMGAHVRSEKVDHTPMVTAPEPVMEIIRDAVAGVGQSVVSRK